MNSGITYLRLDCAPKFQKRMFRIPNLPHVSRGPAVPKQIVVGFGWSCNWGHLCYPTSVTMALILMETILMFLIVSRMGTIKQA